jgi:hypothetical protein
VGLGWRHRGPPLPFTDIAGGTGPSSSVAWTLSQLAHHVGPRPHGLPSRPTRPAPKLGRTRRLAGPARPCEIALSLWACGLATLRLALAREPAPASIDPHASWAHFSGTRLVRCLAGLERLTHTRATVWVQHLFWPKPFFYGNPTGRKK